MYHINSNLDVISLRRQFRGMHRTRVVNFLEGRSAEALYRDLRQKIEWNAFVAHKKRRYMVPSQIRLSYSPAQEQALADLSMDAAKHEPLAYLFDTSIARVDQEVTSQSSVINGFTAFLASDSFLTFAHAITGLKNLYTSEVCAMRFRKGNFMTFQYGTWLGKVFNQRRALLVYHLTPEWKPEWGGMLELRGEEIGSVQGYISQYNCLDVFAFPFGHWVSAVAPFADSSIYWISASLCSAGS